MTLRVVLGTATVVVPVTVTLLDVCGYIAKVEGASMQPCLNPENDASADYVLLNKWAARKYEFKKGEIVSLSSPFKADQKIIKRIIGLEGDIIRTLSYKRRFVKVPVGHCWVEGDNHGQSMDSNMFGPVSLGLINAKASYIVWPPKRWRHLSVFIPDKHRLTEAHGTFKSVETSTATETESTL